MGGFQGFSKESIDFLFELQFHNTIDELPANKVKYKALISAPLRLLYEELAPVAMLIDEGIETRPGRCMSGMYQDMRFCRATPLKTYLYLRFREQVGRETDILGLYFDMGTEGYGFGLQIYHQTAAGMAKIRENILQKQKAYAHVLKTLYEIPGVQLLGDSFKSDHYPDCTSKECRELLNKRNFRFCIDRPVSEAVFSPKLKDEIAAGFDAVKEMYRLLTDTK